MVERRRRALRRRLVWGAMAMATAVALVAAGAAVAGERAHWSGPAHLGPDRPGVPMAVSCATPTRCRAVDSLGNAATYDGAGWSPIRDADDHWGPLRAVSCPTSRFCVSVGGRRAVVRTAEGWGRLRVLPAQRLFAVSCASRTFCLAISDTGFAVRYADTRWAEHRISAPRDALAVSCSSRRFCLALTATGDAYRYDGTVWRRAGEVPVGANGASVSCVSASFCMVATGSGLLAHYHGGAHWTTRRIGLGFVPDAVSCTSTAFCLAVATPGGAAASFDGSWHSPVVFHDYGEGRTPQTPDRLSCSSPGRCLVVDEIGNTFELRGGWHDVASYPEDRTPAPVVSCPGRGFCMALDALGRAWALEQGSWVRTLSRVPGPVVGRPLRFAAVSCASRGFCAAIEADARIRTWDGTGWSDPEQLPSGRWSNLACVTASYCVAVEGSADSVSRVLVYGGDTWADAGTAPLGLVGALDCPAVGECWAGGGSGDVSRYEGEGWSTPEHIVDATDGDGLNRLSWMSCPSAGWCAVHDQYGAAYTWDGVSWSDPDPVGRLGPMSCAAVSTCVAIDGRHTGGLHRYADGWGGRQRFAPAGYSSTVTGLSCPSATRCVAVDDNGNAFVRR